MAAEHQQMTTQYQSGIGRVTGAVGPLLFAKVTVEGTPVEAMVDIIFRHHHSFSPVLGDRERGWHSSSCTALLRCSPQRLQPKANSYRNLSGAHL